MITPSKKFQTILDRLVADKDMQGLIALRGNRVVAEETARMAFSRNRSVKNGEAYRRRGAEKSLVKSAIYQLESAKPVEEQELDEAGIASKLGDIATRGIKNSRDRVLNAMGSQSARARLDLSLVTKQLNKDWKYFATRKAAAIKDRRILQNPVIGDLQRFLATTYGWGLKPHQIKLILGGQGKSEEDSLPAPTKPAPVVTEPQAAPTAEPEAPAAPAAPRKTADELAREALKHTSPEEYAALKRKFGKPTIKKQVAQPAAPAAKGPSDGMSMEDILKGKLRDKMKADMANESVILEAYDDEELDEPFDINEFPRLADIMLDLGFFQIERNGVTTGGGGTGVGGSGGGGNAADGPQTTTARVTDDGHSIDINKMRTLMSKDGISGGNVAQLKQIVAKGPQGWTDIAGNGTMLKTMVSLVNALLNSINSTNSPNNIAASHSVTPDNNVIDINIFAAAMKSYGVSGAAMNQIRQELASGGEQALVSALGKTDSPQAKTIYGLARAATEAIQKVAPAKKKAA